MLTDAKCRNVRKAASHRRSPKRAIMADEASISRHGEAADVRPLSGRVPEYAREMRNAAQLLLRAGIDPAID